MCINPSFIWVQRGPKYEQQSVACRRCWRCRKNRVNDFVGRSLCEAATSQVSCTITLTYAPRDDLADKLLHIRHFQLFMKLLRKAGHKVRYLAAGEYGSLKGRAHFHAILFFENLVEPDVATPPFYNWGHLDDPSSSMRFSALCPHGRDNMHHVREWPHGHVVVDWAFSERSVAYVAKYLLAEDKNNAWSSCSKKPPLGAVWFAEKAARARALGVLPSTFEYLPPGASREKPFLMTGATRRDYLNAITVDPALKSRMSEWVLKTFEKHERARLVEFLEGQPLTVLDECFNERRDSARARYDLQQFFANRRYADYLDDLLSQSDTGILRREYCPRTGKSRWVPQQRKNPNVSLSSSSSRSV